MVRKKKFFFSVFKAAVTGLKPSSPERIGHVNYQKKEKKKKGSDLLFCQIFLMAGYTLEKDNY